MNVYLYVNYKRKKFKVYRITMMAFNYFPGCENYKVNHKDCNPLNNHISNLGWCTSSYNRIHAIRNGVADYVLGENNSNCKLSDNTIIQILNLYLKEDFSIEQIINIYEHKWYIPDILTGCARFILVEKYIVENFELPFTISEVEYICKMFSNNIGKRIDYILNIMEPNIYNTKLKRLVLGLIRHRKFEPYRFIYNKYDY